MTTVSSLKFININRNMHMKTFKEHVIEKEQELEEGYAIDLTPWQFSHRGRQPKGKGTWAFNYKASLDSGGMIGMQQDTFFSKARSTYKNAVKQLTKFLKKDLKVKPKQVEIKLAP